MILPSIDLMKGHAVQLIGGKEKAIDAGEPFDIAETFSRVGEIAVVDLDAALSQGNNESTIRALLKKYRCRVAGGIRDVDTAIKWLDAGATRVVLGTAAKPEILSQLPKERVIAALDAKHGQVVVKGWTESTGMRVEEQMQALRPYVSGFLVTLVESEGRLQGIDLNRVAELVQAAQGLELTVAGGITTPQDVAEIDKLGANAQIGMALYTKRFDLADALGACLRSDRSDGLWPTIVVNEYGTALGLCYSNLESLKYALEKGVGCYWSRHRGLWIKGASSGNTQALLHVDVDCDRDALLFRVKQSGTGFCHTGTASCFGDTQGLQKLESILQSRKNVHVANSYTSKLFEHKNLLHAKLKEEMQEFIEAEAYEDQVHEAADVLYFTLAAMVQRGISLQDVEQELMQRTLKVTRRPGLAKPETTG